MSRAVRDAGSRVPPLLAVLRTRLPTRKGWKSLTSALSLPASEEAWYRKAAASPEKRLRGLKTLSGTSTAAVASERGAIGTLETSAAADRSDEVIDQGMAFLRDGDVEAARQLFALAVTLKPDSTRGWIWRARTAATLEEIIACLERAVAIEPDNSMLRRDLDAFRRRYRSWKHA